MPNANDFIVGLDPTGYTEITGAQLAQLVNSATPQADKGMAILTTDVAGNPEVPDAATTTKWKRYLWVRQSVSSVGLYVWNDNAATDVTYLKWQSANIAGIAAGSIVNSMIADNTIQDAKIVSLDYSKLTGAPSGLAPSGAAGGDLSGTYPNPSVAADAITTAKILNSAVTNAKIADATVAVTKLAPASGSAKDMIRVNAGATAMEAFTPPVLFTSGVVVPTANALKFVQVNAGATDFQMVTQAAIQGFTKSVVDTIAVPANGATAVIPHTLAGIPQHVRVVLHCVTNDAATAYTAGMEIAIEGAQDTGSGTSLYLVTVDATNIKVLRRNAGNMGLKKLGDGTPTTVTAEANFVLKAYSLYIA